MTTERAETGEDEAAALSPETLRQVAMEHKVVMWCIVVLVLLPPVYVTGLDADRQQVHTEGLTLPYDYLIVAGGSAAHFFGVAGASGSTSVTVATAVLLELAAISSVVAPVRLQPFLPSPFAGAMWSSVEPLAPTASAIGR